MVRLIGICVAAALLAGAAAAQSERLTVFAAASLRGPLEQAFSNWPDEIAISYAGSGAIARQSALGGPADLVILASVAWDDWLAERRSGVADEPALLGNSLVLIGAVGEAPFETRPDAQALSARLSGKRLAMGEHRAVPAGTYARAWLDGIGAWGTIPVAEAENVRAALAFVLRGAAPLGIVYATDVQGTDTVSVLWRIAKTTHPPIRYPARAMTEDGARLLDHLRCPETGLVFEQFGFRHLPDDSE